MDTMDINQKPSLAKMNEVIGIYMGGSWQLDFGGTHPKRFGMYSKERNEHDYFIDTEHLDYHKDWNRLMEVVDKISKMCLENVDGTSCTDPQDTCFPITFNMPTDDGKQVMFRFKGFSCHTADTLKEAVFTACYEIAEWENTKTK